jgi:hypothetical protein
MTGKTNRTFLGKPPSQDGRLVVFHSHGLKAVAMLYRLPESQKPESWVDFIREI